MCKTSTNILFLLHFIALNVMVSAACMQQKLPAGNSPQINAAKHILFVGNSLTYVNDLPALVQAIGKEKAVPVKTTMLALPDYSLEDHWNDGKLQQLIAENKFDFVVVQQGPSSQEEGRISLLEYAGKIKTLCDSSRSKLALYMVWPAYSNYHMMDGVIKNYTAAARATNSLLCPVGQVWKDYFSGSSDRSYYGQDMFHPSKKGSEVAATVIFKTLFP